MQKNYFAILKTINENNFRKFAIIIYSFYTVCGLAQNSMVGDGFGGRLWYKPYNYSVGSYSAYTICGDSSQLYGWGDNEYGELGNGTNIHSSIPIKVTGMTNALYYSTGYIMGAIKKNKTGWVWGQFAGNKPVKIIDKVKFLDAGMTVCTFVKTDGTVWSVGQNSTGSFGNGKKTDTNTIVPQKMTGINTAVRVANSGSNNIILLNNGTVMSAGINFDNSNSFIPRRINGLEKITDIKANKRCIIALDQNGFVYTWGDGHFGSLGNGNTLATDIPKKMNSLKNIVAISGCNDGEHFLALDSGHNCYAWGYNGYGQCGVPDVEVLLTPRLIEHDVADIMAGERFSYIVKNNGELWASGMSKGGSIWMNSENKRRYQFTLINPNISPMNMCKSEHLATKIYTFRKIQLCRGDSFKIAGKYLNTAGKYQDTLLKDTCMDTILTVQITFNKVNTRFQNIILCNGEKIVVGRNTYTTAGAYEDTISNYLGCDSVIKTTISILPISTNNQAIEFCEGGKYPVGRHTYTVSGLYFDTFSNFRGCDSIVFTRITVFNKPVADFKLSRENLITYDTIQFINLSYGADRYQWQFDTFSNAFSELINPEYIFQKEGIKTVTLIAINNKTGCMDKKINHLLILDNSDIYIPNAFTPNADGINDYFYPVARNYDAITMQIFNRWGELIYQTNQWDNGWNGTTEGKACMQSVYFYKIELSNTSPFKSKVFSGTLTLLR